MSKLFNSDILIIMIPFIHRLITLLLILYGCGVPFQEGTQPFYRAHDIETTYALIQEGKSTEGDMLRWLGKPTSGLTDNLGRKRWIYLSLPTSERPTHLDVTFKDGIVIDYRLDGSDGGVIDR